MSIVITSPGTAVQTAGRLVVVLTGLLLALCALAAPVRAETGYDAWLRYPRIDDKTAQELYGALPAVIVTAGDSSTVKAAQDELLRGVRNMLGRTLRVDATLPKETAILLGRFDELQKAVPEIGNMPELSGDGFWLRSADINGVKCLVITAPSDRGVLYGTFSILRKIALGQPIGELNEREVPFAPLRIVNQWDNPDGSVERGYAGKSIFWEGGHIVQDLKRAGDYARLLASVGVNGASINRAQSPSRLLTSESIAELARVADVLRPWGVRLYVALDSASPPFSNGRSRARRSDNSDSGNPWTKTVDALYAAIPDFGGFVLNADFGTAVDAAAAGPAHLAATKPLADALQSHNGILFYRASLADADVDAGDPQIDPAKIIYEQIQPLDGQFGENVVVQIKNGPIDFQAREAPSPLFGALERTNQAIELQITQEYLGQQRHLVFLPPLWKSVLDFDMHAKPDGTPVQALVTGRAFERPTGAFVGVANVGASDNWLGHDLAMANLYGFGRLAWDPQLASKVIADEWTRLTFGSDALVVGTIVDMLLKSWRMYENYTGPLGIGTLTDLADTHYGPVIEGAGPGAWRAWHSANEVGVGKDRTTKTGTGFSAQYREPVAKRFEDPASTPEELLLFLHHVPYTHLLKSGKTVIQHIYDSHYAGAQDAHNLVDRWQTLQGKIDDERYQAILKRLRYQDGHAQLWRDAVSNWFLNSSGIADNEGRIGTHPNRFEAESQQHDGFQPLDITPWEAASGGRCVQLVKPDGVGSLSMKYEGKAGWFDIGIRYFDENDGAATYKLFVGGQVVDEWVADDTLPGHRPNSQTSTRRLISRIALRPGDEIRIEATSEGGERPAIDYLEIDPAP